MRCAKLRCGCAIPVSIRCDSRILPYAEGDWLRSRVCEITRLLLLKSRTYYETFDKTYNRIAILFYILAGDLVDPCLVGKWVPDMAKVSRQLKTLSNAPKNRLSGSVMMVIMANALSEFRVKNRSFLRIFANEPDQELLVSGKAKFTVSAPSGSEFHFSEQSNTYKQQVIVHNDGYTTDIDMDPIRKMLPMGGWAHGTLKCDAKRLVFTVTDQDSDAKMFTVWRRK